jgi:hypothetical protein
MSLPQYKLDKPLYGERHKIRRASNALLFLLVVFILAALGFGFFKLNEQNKPGAGTSKRGKTLTQYIGGPKLFKSTYFEFTDTNDWKFAANDSSTNKFTYLLNVDGVPARSITVYVNQTPLQYNLATTRVLPISILGGDGFNVTNISQPCSTLYTSADKQVIKTVSMAGTSFLCVPDSPSYTVILGQINGTYNLSLVRANGQAANYIIIYRDLSVDPDPGPFLNVMKTFRSI